MRFRNIHHSSLYFLLLFSLNWIFFFISHLLSRITYEFNSSFYNWVYFLIPTDSFFLIHLTSAESFCLIRSHLPFFWDEKASRGDSRMLSCKLCYIIELCCDLCIYHKLFLYTLFDHYRVIFFCIINFTL